MNISHVTDRRRRGIALVLLAAWLIAGATANAQNASPASDAATTYYVDSQTGRDSDSGQSEQTPWRSLQRVNEADLQPGDTVRFKCGGVWRGSLLPVSGAEDAPVTYTSYGSGPKPAILGSLPRNRPEDWCRVDERVWATLPTEYELGDLILDLRRSRWRHHQEAGASAEVAAVDEDSAGPFTRITCTSSGGASNHLQIWGPELPAEKDACLLFKFRARSTQPFRFPGMAILASQSPWTGFGRTGPADRDVGPDWQEFELALHVAQSSTEGRLHINLGGILPAGVVFDFQPQSLQAAQ